MSAHLAIHRRLPRYGVRTLLLFMAVICGWLAYEVNWIRQRREILTNQTMPDQAWFNEHGSPVRAPGMLWLFGEQGVPTLSFRITRERFLEAPNPLLLPEVRYAMRLFPEANVDVGCLADLPESDGKESLGQDESRAEFLSAPKVELPAIGAALQIPAYWLDWNAKYENNIHISTSQLAAVREARGEWDKEYTQIVNALLPFDDCVAHLGSEGWGRNAVSWQDVQFRVYASPLAPEIIADQTVTKGGDEARLLSSKVSTARSVAEKWERAKVSYELWYGDYGGTANVDLFAQTFGEKTVVLVFMYADSVQEPNREVMDIVKSFTVTR